MKKQSKTIKKCQFSNKNDLKLIISLGYLPPVNKMEKIGGLRNESIFFPTDYNQICSNLIKKEIGNFENAQIRWKFKIIVQ